MEETDLDLLDDVPRSAPEVAKRCIVLYAVMAAGHGESRRDLIGWLREEGLWTTVSSEEAAFLESDEPARREIIAATWRAEALVPLLWSLGLMESLPAPTTICDISNLRSVLPELLGSTSSFISRAQLRPEDAISEEYESTYEAHWAVRDARLNGRPVPNGYDPGVIQERHHALNWLIGYCGQDWDDVTTDT